MSKTSNPPEADFDPPTDELSVEDEHRIAQITGTIFNPPWTNL